MIVRLTNKQRGILIAILAVGYTVFRILTAKTITSSISGVFIYALPGVLLGYGLYIWDDRKESKEQKSKGTSEVGRSEGQEEEGGSRWDRRESFEGVKKYAVMIMTGIAIVDSLFMLGISLAVGEDALMQYLRVAHSLVFLSLGFFVARGYVLARQMLAILLTGIGLFATFIVMNSRFLGEQNFDTYMACVVWTLFGVVLFNINRIGGKAS